MGENLSGEFYGHALLFYNELLQGAVGVAREPLLEACRDALAVALDLRGVVALPGRRARRGHRRRHDRSKWRVERASALDVPFNIRKAQISSVFMMPRCLVGCCRGPLAASTPTHLCQSHRLRARFLQLVALVVLVLLLQSASSLKMRGDPEWRANRAMFEYNMFHREDENYDEGRRGKMVNALWRDYYGSLKPFPR